MGKGKELAVRDPDAHLKVGSARDAAVAVFNGYARYEYQSGNYVVIYYYKGDKRIKVDKHAYEFASRRVYHVPSANGEKPLEVTPTVRQHSTRREKKIDKTLGTVAIIAAIAVAGTLYLTQCNEEDPSPRPGRPAQAGGK